MKATIYGIASNDRKIRWYVSLDISVDIEYWLKDSRTRKMLLWGPPISLGKAVICRNMLEQERAWDLWHMRDGAERITSRINQRLKELRLGHQRLPNQSQSNQSQSNQSLPRVTAHMIDAEVWRPFGANALLEELCREQPEWNGYSQVEMTPRAAVEFAGQLEGRVLLSEEVISLMEHTGIKQAAGQWKNIVQAAYLFGRIRIGVGVEWNRTRGWRRLFAAGRYRCIRCGSGEDRLRWTVCAACGETCPYCEDCLTMGRSRFCTPLVMGGIRSAESEEVRSAVSGAAEFVRITTEQLGLPSKTASFPVVEPGFSHEPASIPGVQPELSSEMRRSADPPERWDLSPAQKEASDAAVCFVESVSGHSLTRRRQDDSEKHIGPERFLLWAVTGAGKTEMIFPVIERSLQLRRKVLVATPRKDVVLELLPRLQTAFAACRITALYGGSEHRWEQGEIVIATTHQLIRFRDNFDVVILDEIDAFPYHNNPSLEYTALKSCKSEGKFILLSATPPKSLAEQAVRGKLPYAIVPVRHHGYPLPVPVWKQMQAIDNLMKRQKFAIGRGPLWSPLVASIKHGLRRDAQIFLFVPRIRLIPGLVAGMREQFRDIAVDGTSSEDPERLRKVTEFREGRIRLLVTTTILERGVTIPKADVIIIDADASQFDAATLIQMAGRAGRSASDPHGCVHFLSRERTRSQLLAIREIKKMNRMAAQKGFLKE